MRSGNLPNIPAVRAPHRGCAFAAAALLLTATPAIAYVGPGAGLSLAGAVWGLIVALVAAVGFIALWPIRRHLKRRAARSAPEAAHDAPTDVEPAASRVRDDTLGAEPHGINEEPRSATGRAS